MFFKETPLLNTFSCSPYTPSYLASDDVEEQHTADRADGHHIPRRLFRVVVRVAARHDGQLRSTSGVSQQWQKGA